MTISLCAPLLLALAAIPSTGEFTMQGRVLDPARAPIAGALVTATRLDGGPAASTRTDPEGRFALTLGAGGYTLAVAADGFRPVSATIRAASARTESREFVLSVAPRQETVTVSASAGYEVDSITSATRTLTPLRDVPQSVTVVTRALVRDQLMTSIADVVRYVPGMAALQGENNRDQIVIRGNASSADFFLDGVRDDVQYYRDLYNLERIEALKGPNAMMFGRGGGGGVVNRVTKQAGFQPLAEATVQAGAFGHRRVAVDFDRPLGARVAVRVNGMYEDADSFRDGVGLERYGLNPTFTWMAGQRTKLTFGYERLADSRVADRGIPSYEGRPAPVAPSTFFGDPDQSPVEADVHLGSASLEHRAGRLTVRNRTLFGHYDRSYQNFVPGAVSAGATQVGLSAYNNATTRRNVFSQTDLIYSVATGPVAHTLLVGAEVGRQLTDNFRNTGFFADRTTSLAVPLREPTIHVPVTFRQGPSDADNHVRTDVAAAWVQDQLELSPAVQVVAGLRVDRFDLRFHNHRNADVLRRTDHLLSPRAGLVYKPATRVSVYGSYSVSHLPSSGDQFSSLTDVTAQVEPERFTNYEVGVKWDLRPDLSLTAAAYRLDRTNTRATDPNDPRRIVQTGSQRTNGYELGLNGRLTPAWSVAGGYAYQDAFVTRATTAARAGAQVAQVPHHTLSLWSRYQVRPRLGAALGVIHRTAMYAAIDNAVTLPGYTRLDAAVYFALGRGLGVQANLENVLDADYFAYAHNNANISPGHPRALRLALTAAF